MKNPVARRVSFAEPRSPAEEDRSTREERHSTDEQHRRSVSFGRSPHRHRKSDQRLLVRRRSSSAENNCPPPEQLVPDPPLVRRAAEATDSFRGDQPRWQELLAYFLVVVAVLFAVLMVALWDRRLESGGQEYDDSLAEVTDFGLVETPSSLESETAEDGTSAGVRRRALADDNVTTAAHHTPRRWAAGPPPAWTSAACRSEQCAQIGRWLEQALSAQTDPCEKTHRFSCRAQVGFPGGHPEIPERRPTSMVARQQITKKGKTLPNADSANHVDLLLSCLEYAKKPAVGAEDIHLILSSFGLDLRADNEDPKYDVLGRMLELSLEFGLDIPVSFTRKFNVTGDASESVTLQVELHSDAQNFLASWDGIDVNKRKAYYTFCLRSYAFAAEENRTDQLADDLVNIDRQAAEVLNATRASLAFARMTVADLSRHTGVETGRWMRLLALYGRFDVGPEDAIIAREPALSLVRHLAREQRRLPARRFLAWHLLRHLISAKEDVLEAYHIAGQRSLGAGVTALLEVKCKTLAQKLNGTAFVPEQLLKGILPTSRISEAARVSAHIQNTLASVFRTSANHRDQISAPSALFPRLRLYPEERPTDDLLWPLRDVRQPFLRAWLGALRYWHALPPLLQAHLSLVAASMPAKPRWPLYEPPYLYDKALAAYNFAALGQLISDALGSELSAQFRRNKALQERWRIFWSSTEVSDRRVTYCLRVTANASGDGRRKARIQEVRLHRPESLAQVLAAKLSFLAFTRAPHDGDAALPRMKLSPKQLFLVMHCALSCVLRSNRKCMLVFRTPLRFLEKPCGQSKRRTRAPHVCHYV